MKFFLYVSIAMATIVSCLFAEDKETTIWDFKLDSRENYIGQNTFPESVSIVEDGDRRVLQIKNIDREKKLVQLVKFFTVDEKNKMRGKKVVCSVMVKADNIVSVEKNFGRGKFMLMHNKPDNKTDWSEAQVGQGSFEWKTVKFVYDVPYQTGSFAMVLALSYATGTIRFKDLKITVSDD